MIWTWQITFGQAIIAAPTVVMAIWMFRVLRVLLVFRIEHEILMEDWAQRQTPPIKLTELHTRKKFWW